MNILNVSCDITFNNSSQDLTLQKLAKVFPQGNWDIIKQQMDGINVFLQKNCLHFVTLYEADMFSLNKWPERESIEYKDRAIFIDEKSRKKEEIKYSNVLNYEAACKESLVRS